MKKLLSILLTLVASAAGVAVLAAEPASKTPGNALPGAGIGENLILVVADVHPSLGRATTAAARTDAMFGEVEGFAVDDAANYTLEGVHVQTSPDQIGVNCPSALFTKVIDGREELLECPANRNVLRLFRPVELTYVPRSAWSDYAFPAPCGDLGQPPCQGQRYRAVLGEDLSFPSDSYLLLTAFRTKAGAEAFLDLARTFGLKDLVTVTARKLGGGDVGLGQEAHPNGSGPLLAPLPDQTSYQR
jgi:hypothetical protein